MGRLYRRPVLSRNAYPYRGKEINQRQEDFPMTDVDSLIRRIDHELVVVVNRQRLLGGRVEAPRGEES